MKIERAVPWLWALSVLAIAAVVAGHILRPDPITREAPSVELAAEQDRVWINWLGDLRLGDPAPPGPGGHGPGSLPGRLHELIDAELVIANAEGALTRHAEQSEPGRAREYQAGRGGAAALGRGGAIALSLANNHTLDGGPERLAQALARARSAGLLTFGTGMEITETDPPRPVPRTPECRVRVPTCWEPEPPLFLRSRLGTIGIVALAEDYGLKARAAPDTVGFTLLRLSIQHGVRLARRGGADWVVAYVHWGKNYRSVTERQRSWAREFAAAGYDLVIGHHPDRLQPIEYVDGMPVVYSLGNVDLDVAARPARSRPRPALMLTTEVTAEGPGRLMIRCIVVADESPQHHLRPCTAAEAHPVLTSLHEQITVERDVGFLPWDARQISASSMRGYR